MAQLVKKNRARTVGEHDISTFTEYEITSADLSMGISTIDGRYPATGADADLGLEQIWYVLDGAGKVTVDEDVYELEAGDMLHIGKGEPYVIDGTLRLMVASTPAWTAEQHKHILLKASGIIIVDRKVLVGRSKGKEYFVHPGGKLEPGETAKQAAVRELKEEYQIDVDEADLELFDTNTAPAANSPEVDVHMQVFMVKKWQGNITPDNEIEDIRWLTSDVPTDIHVGSIMEHETIPKLKTQNLID